MKRYQQLYEDDTHLPTPKFEVGDIVRSEVDGVVGKVVDFHWFVTGYIVEVKIIYDKGNRRKKGDTFGCNEKDLSLVSGNLPTELGEVPTELYA